MDDSDSSALSSLAASEPGGRPRRVARKPQRYGDSQTFPTKRKRAKVVENGDEESHADDASTDEPSDSDESDDSDEFIEAQPRKKRSASRRRAQPHKPAVKKPKTNGNGAAVSSPRPPSNAIANYVSSLPSRPKQNGGAAVGPLETDCDLYELVFGARHRNLAEVANAWFGQYRQNEDRAVANLVNCILQCAACDQKVTADDIQDPDNAQNKLSDIQTQLTDEGITEYPLITRSRQARSFRESLVGFSKALINTLHETDLLYNDMTLMENFTRWIAPMTSAAMRPIRHTSTCVALSVLSALVDVGVKLDARITKLTQQMEAERSSRGARKNTLSVVTAKLRQANRSSEICHETIRDWFDVVYVHRYRDVDEKIRTECCEALGNWIWTLPNYFLKPEYLRYLGWVLTDTFCATRLEVVKQLGRLFKRDPASMGHFIDRFRPRILEIATRDIDVNCRVAAVEALFVLKEQEMLEPAEIDEMGKLIFDQEMRVRQASVDFFVSNVQDVVDDRINDLGGEEAIEELFGDVSDEDLDTPRKDWLRIKCLAALLVVYEDRLGDQDELSQPSRLDIAVGKEPAFSANTRMRKVGEALVEKVDYVRHWDVLMSYLLHDHTACSATVKSKAISPSHEQVVRNAISPTHREENTLLELFATSVRLSLAPPAEPTRSHKRRSQTQSVEVPSDAALRIAHAIPRLLKKFGAEPGTAVVVLRLEHVLNIDVLQHLRQDPTTYGRVLDEVCTQFERHVDRGVIAEATLALMHAYQHEELQETTRGKIGDLWENAINSLRHFDKTKELGHRGNLDPNMLAELGSVLMKMAGLMQVTDCVDVLDAKGQDSESTSPAIELLVRTVFRGKLTKVDEELDDLEDEVVCYASRVVLFYFMWKIKPLEYAIRRQRNMSGSAMAVLDKLRDTYVQNLVWTLSSRGGSDQLRLSATGMFLDLHVLFHNTLARTLQGIPDGNKKYGVQLHSLLSPVQDGVIKELIEMFDAAEKAYAKRANIRLAGPADDDDPIDDDSSDDEDDLSPLDKSKQALLAERTLCDLTGKFIQAMRANVVRSNGLFASKLRQRMFRNERRLGSNYKATLAMLDENHALRLAAPAKKPSLPQSKEEEEPGRAPNGVSKTEVKSHALVPLEQDESELSEIEHVPEEGSFEDLRIRELLDDPIEDGGDEKEDGGDEKEDGGDEKEDGGDEKEDERVNGEAREESIFGD